MSFYVTGYDGTDIFLDCDCGWGHRIPLPTTAEGWLFKKNGDHIERLFKAHYVEAHAGQRPTMRSQARHP